MAFVDVPMTITFEPGFTWPALSWEETLILYALFLLPFAAALVAFRILKALLPASRRLAAPTLALTTGQAIGFGVDTATIPYGLQLIGPDLAICVAILIWLFLMPGIYAATALILYESIAAAIKIVAIAEPPINSLAFWGLIAHFVLRVLIIVCAVRFIYRRRSGINGEDVADVFV
jgi:hypothetical protein